jgi:hypothetical protein
LLLEKGAGRLAADKDKRTPADLVDLAKWMWDEDGLVRERPKPVYEMVNNPTRGEEGRKTGRAGLLKRMECDGSRDMCRMG